MTELRWGRLAGGCAAAAVLATIAAVPVAARDSIGTSGPPDDLAFLISVGHSGHGQLAALVLRVLGAALLIPLVWVLFAAVRRRAPEPHRAWVPWTGTVGLVVLAVSTAAGFFEMGDLAHGFLAHGPRTLARASGVLDEARAHGVLRAANLANIGGSMLLGAWFAVASLTAMRVQLLTRFLGFHGAATGVATAITLPVAPALQLAWFGSVAFLVAGWWPGGRPAGWDAACAVSWDGRANAGGSHVGL